MFSSAQILRITRGRLAGGSTATNIKGISIDSRTIRRGEAFLAVKGDNFDGHDFISRAIEKGAGCIIKEARNKNKVAPGIACIEVKNTLKALRDIAGYWRKRFAIPLIAVSGTNGKTTTKDMIARVLSHRFKVLKNEGTKNNHIGLPLTLLKLNDSYDMAVLELGTNHPGEIKYLAEAASADIGVITNIGAGHLEYFGNLAGVFKEKYALIHNLNKPAIALLNADDRFLKNEITKSKGRQFVVGFGIKNQSDFFASGIRRHKQKLNFCVNLRQEFELNTLGEHNIYNALVAVAIGRIFGLGYREIAARLKTFDFPEGRLKFTRSGNIRFIDDTYNSNPNSLKQALDLLDKFETCGRKIMVMGDMLELGNLSKSFHIQAGREIAAACDALIAVGSLSKYAASVARRCGLSPDNIFICRTARQAHRILHDRLSVKNNDIVLVKGSRAMGMEEVF